VMWLFRRGLFRPFGPAGLVFAAYRYWRRLPVEQKEEIKMRARAVAARIQRAATRGVTGSESRDG
jgi:hypothetical protein